MTEEELFEWKNNPTTQYVMRHLKDRRETLMGRVVELAADKEGLHFAHRAAVASGIIMGLNEMIELEIGDFLYREADNG